MDASDWIREQKKKGRDDEEILAALMKNEWTEEEALALIDKTVTEQERLTIKDYVLVIIGGFGLAIAWIFGRLFTNTEFLDGEIVLLFFNVVLFIVLGITAFAALLYWVAFHKDIVIFQKLYWLLLSNIAGMGISLLLFMAFIAILNVTGWVVTTVVMIVFTSALSGLSFALTEYKYSSFKHKFLHTPLRKPVRLAVVGLILCLFFAITLVIVTFMGERYVVEKVAADIEEQRPQLREALGPAREVLPFVQHPDIRRQLEDAIEDTEFVLGKKISTTVSSQEFFSDEVFGRMCTDVAEHTLAGIALATSLTHIQSYAEFQQSDEPWSTDLVAYQEARNREVEVDLEEIERLTMGTNFKLLNDIGTCISIMSEEMQEIQYGIFPETPQLENPEHAEMVAFLLYMEE